MTEIRMEEPRDVERVREINLAAFEGGPEADLVDALRTNCEELLSLVADVEGQVVGHILFTPVTIDCEGRSVVGMGLAPMSVMPGFQRQGIGSKLVRQGMELLREQSCPYVIVLGHPEYYPRFGFQRASKFGLRSQWEGVPDEAFMVTVFEDGVLPHSGGVARYRDEFNTAM